jgi:hypothetical protein
MTVWLVGMIIGLPFSVWLLANLCAIIDEPQPLPSLLRLSLSVCLILAVLVLTDVAWLYPLLTSFAVVAVFHIVGFFAMRELGTGVPVYERTPPRPPLLDEEVTENEN